MDDYLLFGLNRTGEPVFSERLPRSEEPRLRELAEARLVAAHAVEVWDGQVCVVRLRNNSASAEL